MFLHILRLEQDVSRSTSHIIITNRHVLSLRPFVCAAWRQRRYCVQTQECHETSTTAVRSSSFLIHVSSLPINILCPVTLFWTKIPMLSAPFLDGCPHFFMPKRSAIFTAACADQSYREYHSVASVNEPKNFSAKSTDWTNFLEQLSPHGQTEYF